MTFDKELVAGKLRRWEKYLDDFSLPRWEELPNFGLYMDQVVTLLREYLNYMPPEFKGEQAITPAAINNYVRKQSMPEPVKKKYYRIHIAYLIIICSLKQSLSIPTLQTMIPPDLTEEELRQVYCAYAARHQIACSYFIRQIRDMSAKILDHEQAPAFAAENTSELIYTVAVASGIARLLAEKLLLLEGKTLEDGGSIEPFSPERAKDEG